MQIGNDHLKLAILLQDPQKKTNCVDDMKNSSIFTLFLLLARLGFAQIPAKGGQLLSIHAGIGLWRGAIPDADYATISRRSQPFGRLGLGLEIPLHAKLTFSPEIGLEAYRMDLGYVSSRHQVQLDADLCLF